MLDELKNLFRWPDSRVLDLQDAGRVTLEPEDDPFDPPARPVRIEAAAPRRLDLKLFGRLAVKVVAGQPHTGRPVDGELKLYLNAPVTLSAEQIKLAAQGVEGEVARWGATEGIDVRQIRLSVVKDSSQAFQELDPAGWDEFQQGGTVRFFSSRIDIQAPGPLGCAESYMGAGSLSWAPGEKVSVDFGLDRNRWIIGRQADAHIRLSSPASHRVLAEIRREAGVLWLTGKDGGEADWQFVPDPRDKARKVPTLSLQRRDGTTVPLGPFPVPLENGDRLGIVDGAAAGVLTFELTGFPREWPVSRPFVAPNLENIRAATGAPRLVESSSGREIHPDTDGAYTLEQGGEYAWRFRIHASREDLAVRFTAIG